MQHHYGGDYQVPQDVPQGMLTLLMQLTARHEKNNRVALVCGLAGFQRTSRQFLGWPSVARAAKRAPHPIARHTNHPVD